MIGSTISHYKILEKLGEGGMGVVYKAQDTKLDRFVALKFLPPHATVNAETKMRFTQEAKSAAALNHPNICTIHGVDEIDGHIFIVMEYIDGGTLRDKIPFAKVDDAVSIAIQIGEALHEAHSKGIVHRDVKADNIMLTSKGQIKVMDFGLAKLKGALKLTRTSSTVGTLAYMAPEQIQGGEVDQRSDIFSFGVLLFEMLTGKFPFRGEHEAALLYSIVNEEPEPITKYFPDASAGLQNIFEKALEKDQAVRYHSTDEMVVDLRRLKKQTTKVLKTQEFQVQSPPHVSTAIPAFTKSPFLSQKYLTGGGIILALLIIGFMFRDSLSSVFTPKNDKKMIVVLPFENLGPNDKEYFVDGMTDEVTSRLSGVSALSVIARSSAMQYKNTTKTFKQIGEELGVNFILQGTVRWDNSDGTTRVRVNPTLIKVEDGTQTWSQSMESVLSSAFKLQSDIASRVAGAMDVALATSEKKSIETSLTENAEAYDYYMQSLEYSDTRISKSDFEIAERLLNRAISSDPSFAAAYARLGRLHASFYWFFYDRTESRAEKARAMAEKALEMAPELSEAHEAIAWYHYHIKLDYAKALEEFNIALKYRPSNSTVYYGIAAVMRRQGNMRGSVESFKKSVEVNPRAADIIRQLAETQTLLREYEDAAKNYDRALELTPDVTVIYWEKGRNLILWKGTSADMTGILETARRMGKVNETENLPRFMNYYFEILNRNFDKAQTALDQSTAEALADNQFTYMPTLLLRAVLEEARGNGSLAKKHFGNVSIFLENKLRSNKDDERIYSAMGLAYAGLGRKEEAIRSGKRAVEMLPVEKEAWRGSFRLLDLARIYAATGEQEKAIDLLERLLSIPGEISVPLIKAEPWWDPLRNNPRYQKLISG